MNQWYVAKLSESNLEPISENVLNCFRRTHTRRHHSRMAKVCLKTPRVRTHQKDLSINFLFIIIIISSELQTLIPTFICNVYIYPARLHKHMNKTIFTKHPKSLQDQNPPKKNRAIKNCEIISPITH